MTQQRNLRRTVLPNGLIVLTERMEHLRSVAMGVWIKSGSRCETAEMNGISHFVEHMLFKGTRSRSAQHIAREMDSIGGNLDAFTGKETICFNVKSLSDHVPIALDVLADLVLNPTFASTEIERERSVILERSSAGQADSGDHQDSRTPRSAEALRLSHGPFPGRKHGVFRSRKSRA
jgi:predicted Zn-dependent peptidase